MNNQFVRSFIVNSIISMGPYLAQPNIDVKSDKGESQQTKIRYSRCDMQGWRRNMEDATIAEVDIGNGNSLFGVFDGHGGLEVSKLVETLFLGHLRKSPFYKERKYKDALIDAFRSIDETINSKTGQQQLNIIKQKYDASSPSDTLISLNTGCTANVVLITPTHIYTANAGDSRSVLCRNGNSYPLSFDHKPESQSQRKRIYNAGGEVVNGRVNGGLNLTRSFGDFNYKKNKNKAADEQLIISRPDVIETLRTPQDQFIMMGCDGIWERYVKDSQPLITRICNERKTKQEGVTILRSLLDSLLAKTTNEEMGCDNMTAVLIEFI